MLAIQWRDLVFLVLINLIWGFNFITSKVGVSELPPLWFTTLRFTLLALILAVFLRVQRGQMGAIVVAGVLSGALHFGLLFVGLGMAKTVSTVAIVGQLGVPFTTLMSIVFLGEVVRWRRWLGITLAFAGVMVMGLDPKVFDFWQGLALVVLSAFVGSIGLLAVKQLKDIKPLEIQAWFAVISVPVLAVLSAVFETGQLQATRAASLEAWSALLFTVVMASLIAHSGYYYLVQRYPITSVSPLTILSPLFGVLFGVTLLGDELTPRIIAGGTMTLTGVVVIALREHKIVETGT
ncbi:MAG TPA: DMT family transporter [Steroidobacteraceae bacterium]|nr:DMT family transporter [Steroidobacteraceae bacterium]